MISPVILAGALTIFAGALAAPVGPALVTGLNVIRKQHSRINNKIQFAPIHARFWYYDTV